MTGAIRRASDAIDRAARGLAVVLISGFTLLLFAAVVCRYLLRTAILFEEEGAKILFIWACFMGASTAYKRRAHIWFNFAERFLGRRGTAVSDFIIHAATLCLFGYFFVGSLDFLGQIWETYFPLIGISQGWVYLALTASSGAMAVHNLLFLLESIQALRAAPSGTEEARRC